MTARRMTDALYAEINALMAPYIWGTATPEERARFDELASMVAADNADAGLAFLLDDDSDRERYDT